MSLTTDRIDKINQYNSEISNERNMSEENRLNMILKMKKMLEDKKITLEVYSDFISKHEDFKSKIKEVEEFIKNIEMIIGYFEPIKFNTQKVGSEIKNFIFNYGEFFRKNEDSIKESALIKFEKYIEDIKEMEELLLSI